MKKKIGFFLGGVVVIAVLIVMLLTVYIYLAPNQYVKNCYYNNESDFELIPTCLRELYAEGTSYIKVTDNADEAEAKLQGPVAYDEVIAILGKLNQQYQKDSNYPVFITADTFYDSTGKMLIEMQVKKEELESGDGIESPDIRCYYLVYIEDGYAGNSPIKKGKAFSGNWYTWSSDTYSG